MGGKGKGLYLSGFEFTPLSSQALQNLLIFASGGTVCADGITDNPYTECAIFAGKIIFINNSDLLQKVSCNWQGRLYTAELKACEMKEVLL